MGGTNEGSTRCKGRIPAHALCVGWERNDDTSLGNAPPLQQPSPRFLNRRQLSSTMTVTPSPNVFTFK
ncbi:unnamed protein product [Cuscuta epithymum]|uniref:Uncharacterized protein n=1 Tax=Cuscuta epithymum TaxID=186058 RepID=A0AAV0CXB3_9ASTE|nr:unnamed protein product [Cuscuta epithymum]